MTLLPGIYSSVLILSCNEVHLRRDREALQNFHPNNVSSFSCGTDAFDFLGQNRVDLVLCDDQLEDMKGIRFVKLLRQNMNLKKVPVVMITTENRRKHVLDAIAAGCTAYILRPYSHETFENHLNLAQKVETYAEIEEIQIDEAKHMVSMGEFDEAIEAYEEIISIQDDAQKYYDMGCEFLVRQKYGRAIIAFKKAVRINDLFAEAFKGLADAYKGKGQVDEYRRNLQKAADIHAQFDRLEETKALFIEILKYEEEAPNPFNTLGVKLRKEGDYMGAIHAYKQALKLTPEDENIHYNQSRAYYFMGDVTEAKKSILKALSFNDNFPEARSFFTKVTGKKWDDVAVSTEEPRERRSDSLVDV